MEALVFHSEEALQVALRSGLVPPEVQSAPAQARVTDDGEVELLPLSVLSPRLKKSLTAAGVSLREPSATLNEFSCWAEVLAPVRQAAIEPSLPQVLFTVANERALLDVAGELLRLGCDRQELCVIGDGLQGAMLRVIEPPWFVVSRALDELDGLRAFVPAGCNDTLWLQLGYTHPLRAQLAAPADGLVLIPREGRWWWLASGPWVDLNSLLVPTGLAAPALMEPGAGLPRVQVPLKLSRAARNETPSLFVLPDGANKVTALVRSTPQAQLDNVLFAVADNLVLLRARPGREASSQALPGEAFARVLDLPNLYAPAGMTVEPPLRRDSLRAWLAPDADAVTWLTQEAGGLKRHALPEAAFRPLSDWVDYVIDGLGEVLTPWVRSATFDFAPFEIAEDARPAVASPTPEPEAQLEPTPRARKQKKERATAKAPAPAPSSPSPAQPAAPAAPAVVELPSSLSEAEARVAAEEAAFLELDAPAQSAERRHAWARLGEMYARVERANDAGMAWAHAVWDATGDDALLVTRRWALTSNVRLDHVLTHAAPDAAIARGAIASLLAAALEGNAAVATRVADYAGFLDRFGDGLDVRSDWLGRYALSRLSGGDALGLARARDRVLLRLRNGLSLDRDVPRLMRLSGQSHAGGAGTERAARVTHQLQSLLRAFDETPRKRSTLEAPWENTRPYVQLEFAWGLARLAAADAARALRDNALAAIKHDDAIAGFLGRAYAARIDQALEGAAPQTPLPATLASELAAMPRDPRYRVDRLRRSSHVLEPQEHVDSISDFMRRTNDPKSDELARLAALKDTTELLTALRTRLDAVARLTPDERARVMDALLDHLPRLPETHALTLLQEIVAKTEPLTAAQRTPVLEDALRVAGHFGREALVKQLVLRLMSAISEHNPANADEVRALGGVLVSGVRSLRRVGLRDEARELLSRAVSVLKGDDVPVLQARLGIASGFMVLSAPVQAQPILDDALTRLSRESGLLISDRIGLTRGAALTYSHAATDEALAGLLRLSRQLPWITDNFSTNPHFCTSLIEFAGVLVLGHVGDDLTLNETTRRFLDEDEYLVRRRVHRDAGELT